MRELANLVLLVACYTFDPAVLLSLSNMIGDTTPQNGTMSNYKPRVSVGLPVYNGEQFLEETLDALLAQAYTDFELIISDNASTDQTGVICREYAAKDQRIRYYCNLENLGVGPNYNRAFKLARGEYFKWATADDVCKPDYLARCVERLESDPTVVLAYPKTVFIDASGRPLDVHDPGWDLRSEAADERLRYVINAGHWVNSILGLIRANALAKTRLLPSYPSGDYVLLGELSLIGKFYEISEYLFLRRIHPQALSQKATDLKRMMVYYTGRSRHIRLPYWNRCLDHFTTIIHAELSIGQKLFLLHCLLRRMCGGHVSLRKELQVAFKWYMGRIIACPK